jgi:hypothetical protein
LRVTAGACKQLGVSRIHLCTGTRDRQNMWRRHPDKDLDHDGDAGHLAAGKGKLDYDRYIWLLYKYGLSGPILLHGLSEAQTPGCVAFVRWKIARHAAGNSGSN